MRDPKTTLPLCGGFQGTFTIALLVPQGVSFAHLVGEESDLSCHSGLPPHPGLGLQPKRSPLLPAPMGSIPGFSQHRAGRGGGRGERRQGPHSKLRKSPPSGSAGLWVGVEVGDWHTGDSASFLLVFRGGSFLSSTQWWWWWWGHLPTRSWDSAPPQPRAYRGAWCVWRAKDPEPLQGDPG